MYLMCVLCFLTRVFQKPEDSGVLMKKEEEKKEHLLAYKPNKCINRHYRDA